MHPFDKELKDGPVDVVSIVLFFFGLIGVYVVLTDRSDTYWFTKVFAWIVVLIFLVTPFILYFVTRDYHESLREMFKNECRKIGVEARDWSELDELRKQHEWTSRGIDYAQVPKIEAYLQRLADQYLPLFDGMSAVKVSLSYEPIQEWPDRVEYNVFVPGLVHKVHSYSSFASGDDGIVIIKKEYFDTATFKDLVYVIKHEMTHCWIDWRGIHDGDHGPEFQRKLREVS